MSSEQKKNNPTPKKGDMVEFPRPEGFSHFGTADGEGYVIHATSDTTASGSVIKKEPLEKVAAGGNFKVKNQDDKKTPLPPDTIVSQANARVGEKVDYGPLSYNCETFASENRYGKGQGHSEQAEKIKQSAAETGKSILSHAKDTHNPFEGK
ncbi:phospholipase A and acyltransferase 2-like [Clupea harengus]|uniref:Phospholipase A and acyltransferase 2-like n=1 Tax=Clupea harengus TaxID=7950 RepID=A0A8M1KEV6_CLUHA|nr:phospholipase A and acyltransferase 2-like [Clupea harengus]